MTREDFKQKISVIISNTIASGNEKRDAILEMFDQATVSGKEVCEYCKGKGWFINEEHRRWPSVQQKIGCHYCNMTGYKSSPATVSNGEQSEVNKWTIYIDEHPTESILSVYKNKEHQVLGETHNDFNSAIQSLVSNGDEASQKELISVMGEYIELLGAELYDTVSYAASHGWSSNRFDEGKRLREKIETLKNKS